MKSRQKEIFSPKWRRDIIAADITQGVGDGANSRQALLFLAGYRHRHSAFILP